MPSLALHQPNLHAIKVKTNVNLSGMDEKGGLLYFDDAKRSTINIVEDWTFRRL
jgi:hypothetical protein